MNVGGFSCPWDSGQVLAGSSFVKPERIREAFSVKRISKKRRQMAEARLRAEVETYNHYLEGNVWRLCEQVFGPTITNSEGKVVATRTIAERHVLQDLKFIPTFYDCFGDMPVKDWMMGKQNILRQMVLGVLENDSGPEKVGKRGGL
jgi:hypothetical protein